MLTCLQRMSTGQSITNGAGEVTIDLSTVGTHEYSIEKAMVAAANEKRSNMKTQFDCVNVNCATCNKCSRRLIFWKWLPKCMQMHICFVIHMPKTCKVGCNSGLAHQSKFGHECSNWSMILWCSFLWMLIIWFQKLKFLCNVIILKQGQGLFDKDCRACFNGAKS